MLKRWIFFCVGIVATGLALLGVWLPGLPTTVFLIIALWAFARSHQRLHEWLQKAPLFKSSIEQIKNFEKHRAVTTKIKIIAQGCAWSSFLILIFLYGIGGVITILVLGAAVSCSIAMYFLPTLKN